MPMKPLRALTSGAALVLLCAFGAGLSATAAIAAEPPTDSSPAAVAIVLPLTVPSNSDDFISASLLESYTSPTGVLTTQLDQVIDSPVTLAIDPMIIASIRILGSSAPASATEWLARLDEADNDTFALAWSDSSLTAPLQAGARRTLDVTSLDYAITPSLFAPVTEDSPTAPPTTDPDTDPGTLPPLPTTESLLEWDYTMSDVAWPAAGSVTRKNLSSLTASGYSTTILDSTDVKRADTGRATAQVGRRSAIVSDGDLSSALQAATDASTSEGWVTAIDSLEASLSSGDYSSAVLAFSRDHPATTERLRTSIGALEGTTGVDIVPLSQLPSVGENPATVIDSPGNSVTIGHVRSMLDAEERDIGFATVAETPELITGQRRVALLVALSQSATRHPGGYAATASAYLDDSRRLESSVRLVKSSEILLLADRTSIFATIANDLDQPITVELSVRALSPLLRIEEPTVEVVVEPSSQKRAEIPVQSLSNGKVTVEATLTSPQDEQVGSTTLVRVNVQAGWEGPVTFVLGAIVVLVFAGGIYRNLILRRRPVQPSPEVPRETEPVPPEPRDE